MSRSCQGRKNWPDGLFPANGWRLSRQAEIW